MKRIICIGNRFAAGDAAGFDVFEQLSKSPLPADTELVDGGLGGLDLVRLVEGTERVVFVDSARGFAAPGKAALLDPDEVAASAEAAHSHGAGLPFLLRVLPVACEGPLPEIAVVGLEAGPTESGVEEAALLALAVATEGLCQPLGPGSPGGDE